MARTATPKPEPKLGAFEMEKVGAQLRHLNAAPWEARITGPIALIVDTIEPNVLVWVDRDDDEGWTVTDFEVA